MTIAIPQRLRKQCYPGCWVQRLQQGARRRHSTVVPAELTRDANGIYPNRRTGPFRGRAGRRSVNLPQSVGRTRRKIEYRAHDPWSGQRSMESGGRKTENCRKKSPRHLRKAAETVRRSTDIVLVVCFRSLAPRRVGGANKQVHAG